MHTFTQTSLDQPRLAQSSLDIQDVLKSQKCPSSRVAQTSLEQPRLQNRYKKVACSKTSVFTMNSITFFKNTSFYNEFYYQKTSVFTVFLKNGPIWDLCFFKNISFYNEFGIFLSACFKNIGFYNEFCMLFAQDETKTYLCSKTSVFTMNYAHFFKNIRFYNELCTLLHRLAQTSLDQPRVAWISRTF